MNTIDQSNGYKSLPKMIRMSIFYTVCFIICVILLCNINGNTAFGIVLGFILVLLMAVCFGGIAGEVSNIVDARKDLKTFKQWRRRGASPREAYRSVRSSIRARNEMNEKNRSS